MSEVREMAEVIKMLKELRESINTMAEIAEATERVKAGKFKDVEDAITRKKIEDGVIAHLNNATPEQIKILYKQRFFQYYHEVYDDISFIKIK